MMFFRNRDDNKTIALSLKPQAEIIILFSAFVFAQLVILRMGNQAGRGYLPGELQELVYLFIQLAVVAGYFIHALVHLKLPAKKQYKPVVSGVLILCGAGALVMLLCPPDSLFYLALTGVTVAMLGFSAGAVYTRLALLADNKKHARLCVGIAYSAAMLLQYVLQLEWTVIPALVVLTAVSFAALCVLLMKDSQNGLAFRETKPVSRFVMILSMVITLALLLFISYYNSYIHHLQISTGYADYNVYSLPRLLIIPTVILFGFIGDITDGRFLPVCTLCVAAVALLNIVLLGRETYLLNMCLYYIALGAVVAYYNFTFLRLAPCTKHPALWAGMGRILDSFAVILSFGFQLSKLPQAAVLAMDIAALAAVIVATSLIGGFNLLPKQDRNIKSSDPFPVIQEKYRITPSELRVLKELVQTDDKQEAIAARLNISVSTLRHHITSIYKKTGTQTRMALNKLVLEQ